ncbi:CoA pyrophosphatase [Alteromonas lipotrueiana]|uniref:CoA pyrophosphatase n=1 Tax=Alteromonas lipotrueiana TaxID=2803815 RepID=UPI001C43DA54|nr:CoA pyrophosphatase [Alteromonas lipotrueiana]
MNRREFLTRFHHLRQVTLEPDFPLAKPGRDAAVLIPLLEYPDGLHVLLTERAHHLRHHPGQISFPGGGFEPQDSSLFETAQREAMEEVGVPPEQVEVIGALPLYRTISGYQITPVVAFVSPNFTYDIDPNEVASVFDVPLAHLMNKQNHLIHHTSSLNTRFPIYFIPWQKRMIWGATAAILRNLSHHIAPAG